MTLVRLNTEWPTMATWSDGRIDQMFRDMFRDFFTGGAMFDRLYDTAANPMHLEGYVEDGEYVIRAEMPGIDPDRDVEITVTDGVLHLRATREERTEEDGRDAYRSEFRYGSFERSVPMPEGTTDADVTASYKDGILEVRIPAPKESTATPTRVPVKHG
jgi:HSP20 family protein